MRNKILFIMAAVIPAVLLLGGLFLLFRDNVGEMIQQEKIKPYVPDFTLLELPKKCNSNQNTSVEVPDKIEKNLTEQVQNLCDF